MADQTADIRYGNRDWLPAFGSLLRRCFNRLVARNPLLPVGGPESPDIGDEYRSNAGGQPWWVETGMALWSGANRAAPRPLRAVPAPTRPARRRR